MEKYKKKAIWRWLQVHLPDDIEVKSNIGNQALKDGYIIIQW